MPTGALAYFLMITFGLAWGLAGLYILIPEAMVGWFGELSSSHPAFILAVWSPALAAFALVLCYGGHRGLRSFLSRLRLWRCAAPWYAYLLVGFPLVFVAGSALKGNLLTDDFAHGDAASLLGAMLVMLLLGPMEEFGWRGVAMPLLQRRFTPFAAGLMLGSIWGVWHLPAFLLSGTPQSAWGFVPFLFGSVCLSVILTPLFNASRGSLLLAVLYHFQANNPLWPDAQPFDSYLLVVVAAIVVWLNRRTMFSRDGAITAVIPRTSDTPRR